MQKTISEEIFDALKSSSEPLAQVATLEAMNKKIVAGFYSSGNGACQSLRENDHAAHLQSGGDCDSI